MAIPNKREVECCASCKFGEGGYDDESWCKEHDSVYVEHFWLCDDYEGRN